MVGLADERAGMPSEILADEDKLPRHRRYLVDRMERALERFPKDRRPGWVLASAPLWAPWVRGIGSANRLKEERGSKSPFLISHNGEYA